MSNKFIALAAALCASTLSLPACAQTAHKAKQTFVSIPETPAFADAKAMVGTINETAVRIIKYGNKKNIEDIKQATGMVFDQPVMDIIKASQKIALINPNAGVFFLVLAQDTLGYWFEDNLDDIGGVCNKVHDASLTKGGATIDIATLNTCESFWSWIGAVHPELVVRPKSSALENH